MALFIVDYSVISDKLYYRKLLRASDNQNAAQKPRLLSESALQLLISYILHRKEKKYR